MATAGTASTPALSVTPPGTAAGIRASLRVPSAREGSARAFYCGTQGTFPPCPPPSGPGGAGVPRLPLPGLWPQAHTPLGHALPLAPPPPPSDVELGPLEPSPSPNAGAPGGKRLPRTSRVRVR